MIFKDLIETEEYKKIWNLIIKHDLKTKIPYKHPIKTKNRVKELSLGRVWFNMLLPDNYDVLIDEEINKDNIDKILRDILNKLGPSVASEAVSNIQSGGFAISFIYPSTFNIDGFNFPQKLQKEIKNFQELVPTLDDLEYIKRKNEIIDKVMDHFKSSNVSLHSSISKGLTGSKAGRNVVGLLFVSKGNTIDIENNIKVIPEALSDGYDYRDFYSAAGEGRRGFFIRSTAVSQPAYMARKLIYANAGVVQSGKDCKTNKYLELLVNKDNFKRIINRYYLNEKTNKLELITVDSKSLIGKKIKMRSPFYCKQKDGLCSTCCGDLPTNLESKNLGILAGGALNNEFVNLMMKQRHKAVSTEYVEVDFINIIKNMPIDSTNLFNYLEIEKNKIFAKEPIRLTLDKNDFVEDMINDYGEYLTVPGFLDFISGEEDNVVVINLPLAFEIDLMKPAEFREEGRYYYFEYQPSELITEKYKYSKDFNPKVLSRILDGVLRYINTPEALLEIILKQSDSTDYLFLEIVIMNMFRSKENNIIPGRLVNYKDCVVIGAKKLPFVDSWLSSLAFEDMNHAIIKGLVDERSIMGNPIEKLMLEESYSGGME